MRDILNKLETLNESTGLAGRKPGDTFRNPDGDEITFNNIRFYPESGGKLEPDELDRVISQVDTLDGIEWLNNRSSRTGGIAVAAFDTSEGEIYFGRYLESIKPNFTDNYVPNQIGDYKFAGKAAVKAQAGLSPQDLLTDKNDLTANDILSQLSKTLGTNNPLYKMAYGLANGDPLPMTIDAPEGVSFSAFRDYFCEILQPIALQRGQYTGNAGQAAKIFLGGSFDDTVISFDDAKTAGLSDSIMTDSEGRSIKVSTKGGKGATASTSNLIKSVDELGQAPNGQKLLEKYSDTIEILREIQKKGQGLAPIYLGLKYDIIDKEDANFIRSTKNLGPTSVDEFDDIGMSDNLLKLAKSRKTDNPDRVSLYYHLMAAVAHKAAEEVNDKTDFSSAAADILNNGALVQVYTKAKESKGKWTLDEFNTVYPSESIKGVYLSAGKTYYSTGIKGNYTFKIDKGQGKQKDDEAAVVSLGREKRVPSEQEFIDKAAEIALGRNKPKIDKDVPTGNVGRAKR
jgi:hypothetical protein